MERGHRGGLEGHESVGHSLLVRPGDLTVAAAMASTRLSAPSSICARGREKWRMEVGEIETETT